MVGLLLAAAYFDPSREDTFVALSWVIASAAACGTALAVVRRSTSPRLHRAWLAWSVACAFWCAGAIIRLVAEVSGWSDLATAADVTWWMFPVLAGASILEDAPRGSLSFGLFLLDALPLVLLATLLARLASTHPLDPSEGQQLLLLGYPLLYVLLALVGLQTLALERNRLSSPNLWGFGVCQPLLAIAALTWPGDVIGGSQGPSFAGEMIWALGFLAASVAAIMRARDPSAAPELRPLDDSPLRALAPALGVVEPARGPSVLTLGLRGRPDRTRGCGRGLLHRPRVRPSSARTASRRPTSSPARSSTGRSSTTFPAPSTGARSTTSGRSTS